LKVISPFSFGEGEGGVRLQRGKGGEATTNYSRDPSGPRLFLYIHGRQEGNRKEEVGLKSVKRLKMKQFKPTKSCKKEKNMAINFRITRKTCNFAYPKKRANTLTFI
jgi:hypothetical protein